MRSIRRVGTAVLLGIGLSLLPGCPFAATAKSGKFLRPLPPAPPPKAVRGPVERQAREQLLKDIAAQNGGAYRFISQEQLGMDY